MRTALISILCFFNLSPDPYDLSISDSGEKHALIVAIGAYAPETDWTSINATNDIPLVKGALMRIGVQEKNITVLQDAEATRQAIETQLGLLADRVSEGDHVIVHFSSHGQQISDDSQDEVDGLDEAIVPYDAPSSPRARGAKDGYDGRLHLRDDELGEAFQLIRKKIGAQGHLLVLMDACHSGTGARGFAKVRGGVAPLLLSKKSVKVSEQVESGFGLAQDVESIGSGTNLGKFILISGSAAGELNYELEDENGTAVGSLSYCFAKTIQSVSPNTTYRTLFANTLVEMSRRVPEQTPQIEGDIDFTLFNNNYLKQEPYTPVLEVISPQELRLGAGTLGNVHTGAKFQLESPGVLAPGSNPLATGVVVSSTSFNCVIRLDRPLQLTPKQMWAFKIKDGVSQEQITVDITGISDRNLKKSVEQSLSNSSIATVVTGKSELVIRGGKQLDIINAAYGTKLGTVPAEDPVQTSAYIDKLIKNYRQGRVLRSLTLHDPKFQVRINRLIPVKFGSRLIQDTVQLSEFKTTASSLAIPEGTFVFVEVINEGTQGAFFNIVDIEPGGKINSLIPTIQANAVRPEIESLKIAKGKKWIIPVPIRIVPPFGKETFKVVSAGEPFDLASTITVPEYRRRAASLTSIEGIFGGVVEGRRDAEIPDGNGVTTMDFVFSIIPRTKTP